MIPIRHVMDFLLSRNVLHTATGLRLSGEFELQLSIIGYYLVALKLAIIDIIAVSYQSPITSLRLLQKDIVSLLTLFTVSAGRHYSSKSPCVSFDFIIGESHV